MSRMHWATGILVIAGLGVVIVGLSVVLGDEEVSLRQVPAAVRATIEKHAGQGEIVEIEREMEGGQVVYAAEVIVNGKEMEFLISATGEYLGAEVEDEDGDEDEEGEYDDEESIPWEQLPQAVQDALGKALPDVQITELTQEVEDGFLVYEAAYETNGREHELELTEGGEIIETEEQIAPSSLPPAILARSQDQFPDAKITEAERVVVTFYEIELKAAGKEHEIKILANGRVLEDEED